MTKKEINTLKSIVNEYVDIDKKMRKNEELIKTISDEQTELMERLEKNEAKEKAFMDGISAKYPGLSLTDLLNFL